MIGETVRPGGLMRCCLATLEEYLKGKDAPSQEGDVVKCRYESGVPTEMVFHDGAWEWNTDYEF